MDQDCRRNTSSHFSMAYAAIRQASAAIFGNTMQRSSVATLQALAYQPRSLSEIHAYAVLGSTSPRKVLSYASTTGPGSASLYTKAPGWKYKHTLTNKLVTFLGQILENTQMHRWIHSQTGWIQACTHKQICHIFGTKFWEIRKCIDGYTHKRVGYKHALTNKLVTFLGENSWKYANA